MATLPISFLFCIVLLLIPLSTRSTPPICLKTRCGRFGRELPIEFPFYLRESNKESDRCGYPGFEVSCNNKKQALLTFQYGGEFVVTGISIEQQRVWINDPDECLPRRYLQNINLTDSPFQLDKSRNFQNLIFLNCTKSEVDGSSLESLQRIPCLSNDEFTIIYTLNSSLQWNLLRCHEIGSALVPIKDNSQNLRLIWEGLHSDIILQWDEPLCGNCEADQHCGFLTDTGLDVTCYDDTNFPSGQGGGRPSTLGIVRYLPVAWGISVLLFLFCITISFVLRGTLHGLQRETNREIESNFQQPPMAVDGIDRSTIEKFPKIQVGERGQLPKPIDNVCSICLSEYEPMETLRSIPQCNHYFHAQCIDAWLKMNATCPLCRNLPEGSV